MDADFRPYSYAGHHAKQHPIRQWVIRHNIKISVFIAVVAVASLVITWQAAWGQVNAAPMELVVKPYVPAVQVYVPAGLDNPSLDKAARTAATGEAMAQIDARLVAHLDLLHKEHLAHLARLAAEAAAARAATRASATATVATHTASVSTSAPATTSPSPSGSGVAGTALAWALAQEGKPYIWGGTGPDGFDCSGLVMTAYEHAGIQLPRTTYGMLSSGQLIPTSTPQPGDLAFYGSGHVELYARPGVTFGAHDSGSVIGYINEWEVPAYYRVG